MHQKVTGPTPALAVGFIGTFSLIFIGAGAATALGANHDPAVAFAPGLTIMMFADRIRRHQRLSHQSGGDNWLGRDGRVPDSPRRAAYPDPACRAIAPGYCPLYVFGGPVSNLGATVIDTHRITYAGAFAFEALGTFFLVNTVFAHGGATQRSLPDEASAKAPSLSGASCAPIHWKE
jgi:glycerol uptake facilitator-like aquaporin